MEPDLRDSIEFCRESNTPHKSKPQSNNVDRGYLFNLISKTATRYQL